MGTSASVAVSPAARRNRGGAEWAPTDLSGCVLWLRADLGITLNGSDVSAWADQSGQGRDLSQGTASMQPEYKSSGGPNGLPYVEFDPASKENLFVVAAQAQPVHAFVIGVLTRAISAGTMIDGAGQNHGRIYCSNAGGVPGYHAGSLLQVAKDMRGIWARFEGLFNGANSSAIIGGETPVIGNAGTNSIDGLALGASVVGGTPYSECDCNIAEVIQYSSEITGADLTALRAYINARYGL